MRDPFAWLSRRQQKRAFLGVLVLTLVLIGVMSGFDRPLRTAAAPQGIVSFELAGDGARAGEILASWDEGARVSAGLSLGMDYLFLLAYSLSIGLGCVLLAGLPVNSGTGLAVLAGPLAWAQIIAALLDAVENAALIRILQAAGQAAGQGADPSSWAALARGCAVPKFVLVLLGLVYLIAVGLRSVARGRVARDGR